MQMQLSSDEEKLVKIVEDILLRHSSGWMKRYKTQIRKKGDYCGKYMVKWTYVLGLRMDEKALVNTINDEIWKHDKFYHVERIFTKTGWGRNVSIKLCPIRMLRWL